jgi:hypothetical protein
MKIRPVGAELFHADGRTNERTDIKKLTVACRDFASVPKNRKCCDTTRSPDLICDHGICQRLQKPTMSLVRIRL